MAPHKSMTLAESLAREQGQGLRYGFALVAMSGVTSAGSP